MDKKLILLAKVLYSDDQFESFDEALNHVLTLYKQNKLSQEFVDFIYRTHSDETNED